MQSPPPAPSGPTQSSSGSAPHAGLHDRFLDAIGHMILHRKDPQSPWRKVLFLTKLLIYAINLAYLLALFGAMAGMNLIGERNLAFATVLFAPAWFWLLPLAFLIPFCFFTLRWKLLLLHLGVIAGFLLVYMDYEWRLLTPTPPDDALVIFTYNRGQHQNQSMRDFVELHDPDFICLQEARARASRYSESYGMEGRNAGEFVLLSRFPILDDGMIQIPHIETGRTSTFGAWFTVDWNGTPLVIYQIHTLSPRDHLYMDPRPIGLGLLALVPFSPYAERHRERNTYWRQRIAEITHFAEILENEDRPFLVAGDFNMVDRGYMYDLIPSHVQDTHEKAGRGYGYTFPGTGGGLPTFYKPWLRIDYIFAGPTFKVLYCDSEPRRPSQHRAVAAAVVPR